MANIWENAVITNKGIGLLGKLLAGETLNFSRVAVGSGRVNLALLREQTAITSEEMNAKINTLTPLENNMIMIPVLLTNDDVTHSFDLWQVGIYATDPEEGEILFFLAQTTSSIPIPTPDESSGYTVEWNFHVAISNDLKITATIEPAGLLTIAQGDYRYLSSTGIVDGGHFIPIPDPAIVGTFIAGEKYAGGGLIPRTAAASDADNGIDPLAAEAGARGQNKTVWQDYITPVDANNMNKIEETLEEKVDKGHVQVIMPEF